MKQKVGVLGVGEVGTAIVKLLKKVAGFEVYEKDITYDHFPDTLDVLHVCIPYSSSFIKHTIDVTKKYSPKLIIIHTTVDIGTTKRIYLKTKVCIAHAPIRGDHPNLEKNSLKFKQFIGPVNSISAKMAQKHLRLLGYDTEILNSSSETEAGKLLDTTYYGWNILYCKYVSELCQKYQLDFNDVYTKFNITYNEGYMDEKPQVIRPVLKNIPGKIGGHCIVPNAKILAKLGFNPAKVIISKNEKL